MNENSMRSVVAACVMVVLVAICISIKGCNDSDDNFLSKIAEQHCDYLGDTRMICHRGSQ